MIEGIERLAVKTERWMKRKGAIWTDISECGGVIGHITVAEWAERFSKDYDDICLDEDGNPTQKTQKIWGHVKLEMIQQGIPIARHAGRGHFLGQDGDQATNIILNVKTALALLNTATQQLEAVHDSGKYVLVAEKCKGYLVTERLVKLLQTTPGIIPERYGGIPSEPVALLMSGE